MEHQPPIMGRAGLNLPSHTASPIARIDTDEYTKHEEYAKLYYDTDSVLKAKGFTWPYLLADLFAIIQTLPEDNPTRVFFWNHFFTVVMKKDQYPTVLKQMTVEQRRANEEAGNAVDVGHLWDDNYTFPDCLHENNLPLVAIAYFNYWDHPIIRAAPRNPGHPLVQAPHGLWCLLYLATRRIVTIEPLHGKDRHARKHAHQIKDFFGGCDRDVFGVDFPHGKSDGSCRNGTCDILIVTMLVQQLSLLGQDHCAAYNSIRACDVTKKGYIPPLLNTHNYWTPFHGFGKLANIGFERNAYIKEIDAYDDLKEMMIKGKHCKYGWLPKLHKDAVVNFTVLQGEQLFTA
ncbi:hypothetical protein IAU59_000671 [Kwoniella sp. CBS 9459]